MKPHICLYHEDHLETVHQAHRDKRIELAYSELFIEVAA